LGDIGDVVWSLPAIRAVRENFPAAQVAVLVREGSGSLLEAEERPPVLFEVRKANSGFAERIFSPLSLVWSLWRQRFDLVIDLRGDERGGYMAFLTGAPIRAALHYPALSRLRNYLFTHLVATSGQRLPVGAADLSLYILRAFGIENANAVPRLDLSSDAILRADRILVQESLLPESLGLSGGGKPPAPVSGRWVTVNPFSRWSYKEWDMDKWAQIIDWLWKDCGFYTVVVGSNAEKERAETLIRSCVAPARNLAGKTTLAELAGVLRQSALHVGVDSAAPHIAAAVGTPTVTIYGPSDWRYWTPPGKGNRVITPEMECAPCHMKGCEGKGISRCLDSLPVERVKMALEEILPA
jgi:heptosyltransferase-3